jgi:Tol biopolymer transport system component/DNA-binding winged helix-turn-helix (wHTH) protein
LVKQQQLLIEHATRYDEVPRPAFYASLGILVAAPVYQFGDFRLDCGRFELSRGGRSVPVERKPMELLILLAEREGQLVTRTEIAERLWERAVFVDTEHGINTAIRKIRQTLRDDPDEPRFVQTVMGKGYRFVAEVAVQGSEGDDVSERAEVGTNERVSAPTEVGKVEVSEDDSGNVEWVGSPSVRGSSDVAEATGNGGTAGAAAQPGAQIRLATVGETVPANAPDSGVRKFRRRWLVVPAVVAIGLTVAIWYMRRPLPPPRISDPVQINHDGYPKDLAGTDGSRLYLSLSFSGPQRIAQVAMAGGEIAPFPVPLPNPILHDVSQDGSSFLVGSEENGQQSLWDLQVPGGTVRRMANGVIQSAAWSTDGRSVVYSTQANDIFMVKSDGTDLRKLVAAEDHNRAWAGNFAWSPDGAIIRFNRGYRLWEVSSDGSGLHQVLPDWRPSSKLFCGHWTPDGKFFLFLARDHPSSAVRQIWALDESRTSAPQTPSDPVQLTSGPIFWDRPIPGRDGKKIFASGFIRRGEMVRYHAPTRELKPWLGGISAEHLSYSPDGKSIVYVSYPEGILWRANPDGTNPIQLTGPPYYPLNPRWSPDGSRILFCSDQDQGGGDYRIYIVSSQGGTPQPILPDDRGPQIDPNWSPDGRKIIFASGVPYTPEVVLRILDLASHQIVTLPGSQGISSPRWSPDSRFVAGINQSFGCSVFDFDSRRWSELQKGRV